MLSPPGTRGCLRPSHDSDTTVPKKWEDLVSSYTACACTVTSKSCLCVAMCDAWLLAWLLVAWLYEFEQRELWRVSLDCEPRCRFLPHHVHPHLFQYLGFNPAPIKMHRPTDTMVPDKSLYSAQLAPAAPTTTSTTPSRSPFVSHVVVVVLPLLRPGLCCGHRRPTVLARALLPIPVSLTNTTHTHSLTSTPTTTHYYSYHSLGYYYFLSNTPAAHFCYYYRSLLAPPPRPPDSAECLQVLSITTINLLMLLLFIGIFVHITTVTIVRKPL
ncbi:hypothetical protein BC832DRAFT_323322 [Gaertneriomyces semiglobifer]|nr:hypothetical protein BC832DRAFT_323322 [Gaertneriomyces semiglobifer]